MWVMLTTGAVSIVERRDIDKDEKRVMVVRSRRKEWINSFRTKYCPKLTRPIHVEGRDYQWRAYGTREDVALGVGRAALDIRYSNFKSATETKEFGLSAYKLRRGLADAYHKVWTNILDAGDGTSVYDYKGGYGSFSGIEACYRWGHLWDEGDEKCRDCGEVNPNYPDAGPTAKPKRPAKSAKAKTKSYGLGTEHTNWDDRCSGSWTKADKSTYNIMDRTVECGVCHTRQPLIDSGRIVHSHNKPEGKAA